MKKILFVSLILLSFISCKKDDIVFQNKFENLKVDKIFDWKTTKDYFITISTNSDGLLLIQSDKGCNYLKLFVFGNQTNSFKLTLPSYETKIILMLNGVKTQQDLINKNITLNFNIY